METKTTKESRPHIHCDDRARQLLDKAATYARLSISEFVLLRAVAAAFDCGQAALDDYIRRYALRDVRRNLARHRFAHRNSVASMERPMGMTINAGPGKTISATPISVTVPPITATTMRLATR